MAKGTIRHKKGRRFISSENLVSGTIYYISLSESGNTDQQFSGTARFSGFHSGAYSFVDMIPDEFNSYSGDVSQYVGHCKFFMVDLDRIHEAIPIGFPYAIGNSVTELHEMTIGKNYYILKTPVSQFNGVAKYLGYIDGKARFGSYQPDENNLWNDEARASYPTFGVNLNSKRIFEAIPLDNPPVSMVKEEAKEEPPISLEESQRMIQEIQVAYEYLEQEG